MLRSVWPLPDWSRKHGMGLSVLLAMGVAGCGGSAAPTLAPVVGKVQSHGRPITSGLIVFTPDESCGTVGPVAVARIGTDGSFILRSDEAPGAVPGCHRITVASIVPASGSTPPRSVLPDRYRDPMRSGLRFEVAAGRENVVQLNLE